MLTGRKPFKAETAPALVYQHVHAPIPQLPDVVHNYQPIVDLLLAKDPEARFSSAEELIAGLGAIDKASRTLS